MIGRPWVNLGCGTTAPAGWVNIDRSPGLIVARFPSVAAALRRTGVLKGPQAEVRWPDNIRRLDVRKGLPYPSGSVGVVYSSHMLEHLPRADGAALLREARRVLRRDGLLRLALPDLRSMARTYCEAAEPGAADEFMRVMGLGYEARPHGSSKVMELASGARHRWMYDIASISALLRECGFDQVNEWSYREGRCPELEAVEHREDSLFVEGSVAPTA